jgi:hypothetical protein
LKTDRFPNREAKWPRVLYRYRPLRSLEDLGREFELAAQSQVWLSKPSEFNDPYDSLFLQRGNTSDLTIRLREEFLICCFSANPYSLPMWAHYADNHRGVCLEYNVPSRYHAPLYPVIYDNKRYEIAAEDNVATITATPRVIGGIIPPDELSAETVIPTEAITIKAKEWKYEKEWRLVICGGIKPNKCMPELESRQCWFGKPSRVILGVSMRSSLKKLVTSVFSGAEIVSVDASLSPTRPMITFPKRGSKNRTGTRLN